MENTPLLSVDNILSMAYGNNNEGPLFILQRAFRTELGRDSDKNDENKTNILAQNTLTQLTQLTQLTYRDVTSFVGAAAVATAIHHGHNLRLRK